MLPAFSLKSAETKWQMLCGRESGGCSHLGLSCQVEFDRRVFALDSVEWLGGEPRSLNSTSSSTSYSFLHPILQIVKGPSSPFDGEFVA